MGAKDAGLLVTALLLALAIPGPLLSYDRPYFRS